MKTILLYIFLALALFKCTQDYIKPFGTVLFYTNIQFFLNCGPFDVEIYINGEYKGKIVQPLLPIDSIPNCNSIDSLTILKIELPVGQYDYEAKASCLEYIDISGEFIITEEGCTIVHVYSGFEDYYAITD